MFKWILLAVLILPAMEVGILVWAGGQIGPWWVVLFILATGVAGTLLARQQGTEAIRRAKQGMAYGEAPQEEILDGICILVGSALLLTPGFITDGLGFLLLLPPTRKPIKKWMVRMLRDMMEKGTISIFRR